MNKKTNGIIAILGIILLGGIGLSGRTTESAPGPRNIPTPLPGLENAADPTLADLPPSSPVHRERTGVHGRILDAAGLAVAGATVMAFQASRSMGRCCMSAPTTPLAKTDFEGRFRFPGIHPGVELVAFKTAGQLVSRVVETSGPHLLSFPGGKSITGIVQDGEGNLLSNVKVRAFVRPVRGAALRMGHPLETVSDATGSYSINPVAPGTSVLLEVSLSGYRPVRATVLVEMSAPVASPLLIMKRGARLAGSIVSSDGSPLSGVLLTARQRDGILVQVSSSDDGRFEIRGIGEGEIQLTAQLSGFTNATVSVPGAGAPVEIRLLRARSIEGKIYSARTGLFAVAVQGNSRHRTPVQSDGSFFFSNISGRNVRILIESKDRNILVSRRVDLDDSLAALSISLP